MAQIKSPALVEGLPDRGFFSERQNTQKSTSTRGLEVQKGLEANEGCVDYQRFIPMIFATRMNRVKHAQRSVKFSFASFSLSIQRTMKLLSGKPDGFVLVLGAKSTKK